MDGLGRRNSEAAQVMFFDSAWPESVPPAASLCCLMPNKNSGVQRTSSLASDCL